MKKFIIFILVFGILFLFHKLTLKNEIEITKEVHAQESEKIDLLPELKPICSCESSYSGRWNDKPRHFNPDGTVRRGKWSSDDVGICQINEKLWSKYAKSLGLDLLKEQDNIIFANVLFTEQGWRPWIHSKKCWKEK